MTLYYKLNYTLRKCCYYNTVSIVISAPPLLLPTRPLMLVPDLHPQSASYLVTETSLVSVTVYLSAPTSVTCDKISAALTYCATEYAIPSLDGRKHRRNESVSSFNSAASVGSSEVILGGSVEFRPLDLPQSRAPQSVDMQGHFEYAGNRKSVCVSSGLKSKQSLRRVDSNHKAVIDREVEKTDYGVCVDSGGAVTLTPGSNQVTLTAQVNTIR